MALGVGRFRPDGWNRRRRTSPVLARVAVVIVSLLGWIIVVRDILLLAFPDTFMSIANHTIGAENPWRVVFGGITLVGLYLTYVGWISRRKDPVTQPSGSTPELPSAA